MKIITQKEIKEINEAYLEIGTYAGVARKLGFSPSTIKKYVIDGYTKVDESKVKHFTGPLPEFDPTPFRCRDWGHLCELSEEEMEEMKSVWEEIEV